MLETTTKLSVATVYICHNLSFSKDKSYSYIIPEKLSQKLKIGSLVLVSLGNIENLIGLVVDIKNSDNNFEYKLKEIKDCLNSIINLKPEHLDFYKWLAINTCSDIGSVLLASYPIDLLSKVVPLVKPCPKSFIPFYVETQNTIKQNILKLITQKSCSVSVIMKKNNLTKSDALKLIKELIKEEFVEYEATLDIPLKNQYILEVELSENEPKTPKEKKIYNYLIANNNKSPINSLISDCQTNKNYLNKMAKNNLIKFNHIKSFNNYQSYIKSELPLPQLNDCQLEIFDNLSANLFNLIDFKQTQTDDRYANSYLLYGVTGAGKTMVYLHLIKKCIELGKNVLILVPEISLTPSLIKLVESYFPNIVYSYHSKLNATERFSTINALSDDSPKIYLGARSLALLPFENLGLIIMDEEHDNSYKQSSAEPRYHTRDICLELSIRHKALLLLVSATPDLNSYYHLKNRNRILYLTQRYNEQKLPQVQLVDMKNELYCGNKSIFSQKLKNEIANRLAKNEQVILLLNRRGFFSHVFCRSCGQSVSCQNCSIDLVFHQNSAYNNDKNNYQNGILMCHHCGFKSEPIINCPKCQSFNIKHYGLGIQKVEQDTLNLFPNARLLRLDSDSITQKGSYEKILERFSNHEADILIGTQLVAKGLNFPNVTLVGIILADTAFSFPDYRSYERGYQLMTQVSGRSGRSDKPGSVVMQSYNPELPIFEFLTTENYLNFAKFELDSRQKYNYPPFASLIRVISSVSDISEAQNNLIKLNDYLYQKFNNENSQIVLLGPTQCPISYLHNKYRFHLIIKVLNNELLQFVLNEILSFKKSTKSGIIVDSNPTDLL